jgi:hypothetical protein
MKGGKSPFRKECCLMFSVYEALTLMIAFATLIVLIIKESKKSNYPVAPE